ncbi:MAG: hypothetical protein VW080_00495 [Flavobacteriaceae bacterium]
MKNRSALEVLEQINTKLENGQYKDSVHKIKLLTAKEMIKEILETEF